MEKKCGFVICDCKKTLSEKLSFDAIKESLLAAGAAAVVSDSHFCGPQGKECLASLKKQGAEIIIAGACTPRILEEKFQSHLSHAGLSSSIFRRVNLREQCAWVTSDPRSATQKAVSLLKRAIHEPFAAISEFQRTLSSEVIVIGGGRSGLIAAEMLAALGHQVTVIEKKSDSGGAGLQAGAGQDSGSRMAENTPQRLKPEILFESRVSDLSGQFGEFIVTIDQKGAKIEKKAGAILIATGFDWKGREEDFSPDLHHRIIGFEELSQLTRSEGALQRISAMAIYLDEASEMAPFFSFRALQESIALKERGLEVYVIYKNMKVAYDEGEMLYRRARRSGVVFLRALGAPILKEEGGALEISLVDTLTWMVEQNPLIRLKADLLVVPEVPVPHDDTAQLLHLFRVHQGPGGFFQENNVSLEPLRSNRQGIFYAGSCTGPKDRTQSWLEGFAAAAEIHSVLNTGQSHQVRQKARIASELCALCLTCVRSCPHRAADVDYKPRELVAGAAKIDTAACEGCGICVAECPARAIKLVDYHEEYRSG